MFKVNDKDTILLTDTYSSVFITDFEHVLFAGYAIQQTLLFVHLSFALRDHSYLLFALKCKEFSMFLSLDF